MKALKVKYRVYGVFLIILVVMAFLFLIYLGYTLIDYLKEPDDSKLAIFGFVVSIIVLFPIYIYGKKLLLLIKTKIKTKFRAKADLIVKQSLLRNLYKKKDS